jgi:hypothetical protein
LLIAQIRRTPLPVMTRESCMNGTPITWASIARFAKAGALLAFFLPWLTVSCQGTEVMSATGWGLVTGSPDWASGRAPPDSAERMALTATAALALGAWALFISFSNASAKTARMAMVLSLAAAAAAFAAPWEVMAGLEAAMKSGGNQAPNPSPLSVEREIGGWVAVLGYVAGSAGWFMHLRGAPVPGGLANLRFPDAAPSPPAAGEPAAPAPVFDGAAALEAARRLAPRGLANLRSPDAAPSPAAAGEPAAPAPVFDGAAALEAARRLAPTSGLLAPGRLGPLFWTAVALGLAGLMTEFIARGLWSRLEYLQPLATLAEGNPPSRDAFAEQVLNAAGLGALAGLLIAGLLGGTLRGGLIIGAGALAGLSCAFFFRAESFAALYAATGAAFAGALALRAGAVASLSERFDDATRASALGLAMGLGFGLHKFLMFWSLGEADAAGPIKTVGFPMLSLALGLVAAGAAVAAGMALQQAPPAAVEGAEESPKSSAFGALVKDGAALHLILAVLVPVLLTNVLQGAFLKEFRDGFRGSDQEFRFASFVTMLAYAPAVGLIVGGIAADVLSKRDARWRAYAPAALLGAGIVAVVFSLSSQDKGLFAGVALAALYAPVAPALGYVLGRVRSHQRTAAAAIVLLGYALIWSPLPEIAASAIREFASAQALSGAQGEAGGPASMLLALALLMLWPLGHLLIAAQAMGQPAEDRRAPIATLAALGVGAVAALAATAWTFGPGLHPSLAQARAQIEAALSGKPAPVEAPAAELETATHVAAIPDTPGAAATEADAPPDTLRIGQSWDGFLMDQTCRLMWREDVISQFMRGGDENNPWCEVLTQFQVSPSGRYVMVHAAQGNHGHDGAATVDRLSGTLFRQMRDFGVEMYHPLNVWSEGETHFLAYRASYLEPIVGGMMQHVVLAPCALPLGPGEGACADAEALAAVVERLALQATPEARCIRQETCFQLVDIRNGTPVQAGFALEGDVALTRIEISSIEALDDDPELAASLVARWRLTALLGLGAELSDLALTPP